jgi:hypothetical protein
MRDGTHGAYDVPAETAAIAASLERFPKPGVAGSIPAEGALQNPGAQNGNIASGFSLFLLKPQRDGCVFVTSRGPVRKQPSGRAVRAVVN